MYQSHPDVRTPADGTVIWRYVNMEKLLALLSARELLLSRMDVFEDPWEGVWPRRLIEALHDNAAESTVKDFLPTLKGLRKSFYVSCWHGSPHESAALWGQYSGVAGFAIKSTIGSLKSALSCNETIYVGAVQYSDYDRDFERSGYINALQPSFMKRKSFEHEREIRVLNWMPDNIEKARKGQDGDVPAALSVKVDLSILINELNISPTAPKWLDPHVQELLQRFDLGDVTIKRSTLYDPVVY